MAGENKTQATSVEVEAYLATIEPETRRSEGLIIAQVMQDISGHPPRMWGPSMIGFGTYHYRYDSGREGDMFRIGFAPRKPNLVLYGVADSEGFDDDLAALGGKATTGKSCLYIKRLSDVDMNVLERIIQKGWAHMAARYPD
jgi:Domain of unknown function (DU1801)